MTEKTYLAILDSIQDSVIVADLDNKISYWNKGAEKLFGLESRDTIGQDINLGGKDNFTVSRFIEEAKGDLTFSKSLDWSFIDKNGRTQWILIKQSLLISPEDKSIIGVIGVSKNITERKEASNALIISNNKLELVNNHIKLGVWERDLVSNTFEANDIFYDIWGLTKGETEKNDEVFFKLIHPEDREKAKQSVERIYNGNSLNDFEFRIQSKDNVIKYISRSAIPIKDKDGKVIKTLGIDQDVTKDFKINQANLQNAENLRLASKAAGIGFWEINIEAQTVEVNDELLEIYELSRDQISSEFNFWLKYMANEKLDEKLTVIMQGNPISNIELKIKTQKGNFRYLKVSATPMFNSDGQLQSIVGVSINNTHQKGVEDRLQFYNNELVKRNEELDHFAYSTSHNLRAPLASILGLTNLIDARTHDTVIHEYLGLVRKSGDRMDETIREISDYFKNARLGVNIEKVQLKAVIDEIIESLTYMNETHEVIINNHIPAAFIIKTDLSRLKTIANNLISNGIKYSNSKNSRCIIDIRLDQKEDNWVIHFEDNGIGIPHEEQEKIFNMFYRATEMSNGTGLGLYIVMETIKKLDGKIEVVSDGKYGTNFKLLLPKG